MPDNNAPLYPPACSHWYTGKSTLVNLGSLIWKMATTLKPHELVYHLKTINKLQTFPTQIVSISWSSYSAWLYLAGRQWKSSLGIQSCGCKWMPSCFEYENALWFLHGNVNTLQFTTFKYYTLNSLLWNLNDISSGSANMLYNFK